MFDLYRQARQRQQQQRQELGQAAWAMVRAEPWRFVTLPLSLALAVFLEWALWGSGEHSLTFWWLTALGVSAVMLGGVRLQVYARMHWERKQPLEEGR
jgi:hypothetical protein